MDGIIVVNKPAGLTSAKVVYRLRKITGEKKSGHAGTLDPFATGVLLVCLGRATKLVERVMNLPKVYRAAARLDVTSESYDCDRPMRPVDGAAVPTAGNLSAALQTFEGWIEQIPPRISAVKINGVPAYKRSDEEVSGRLKARPVHVHWLVRRSYEWPAISFELCCSRGTYVRALIRDLGDRLGTGGCLTALHRVSVGRFDDAMAKTLDELAGSPMHDRLISLDSAERWLDEGHGYIPSPPNNHGESRLQNFASPS